MIRKVLLSLLAPGELVPARNELEPAGERRGTVRRGSWRRSAVRHLRHRVQLAGQRSKGSQRLQEAARTGLAWRCGLLDRRYL